MTTKLYNSYYKQVVIAYFIQLLYYKSNKQTSGWRNVQQNIQLWRNRYRRICGHCGNTYFRRSACIWNSRLHLPFVILRIIKAALPEANAALFYVYYLHILGIMPLSKSFMLYKCSIISKVSSRFPLALIQPFPSVNQINVKPSIVSISVASVL